MSDSLTVDDIREELHKSVTTQDYSNKPVIDDVKLINIKNHIVEEGDFSELFRIGKDGYVELEELPSFKIAQINRTNILPGVIKAWHLHFLQEEVWFIAPSSYLFVGLWDVRKKSKTTGNTMRIMLGAGESKLLYIPKGVAHGCSNISQDSVDVYYFINGQFDKDHPDEKRLPWNARGENFWTPERE